VEFQSTRTVGVEANVNYFILPVLNVSGNVTYQQHQLTENETDPELVGNWLRRQPRIMGMVALNFKNDRFDASISDNFIGRKFANTSNTVELAGYGIVRLDGGYTLNLGEDETLRLGVSVFNLLNAAGVTEGSPRQGNAQIQGGDFFVGRPILPRRLFIRAAFNF
ncbi:MAG TPA: TonB-dependent receptor, partial [Cytophagales bacterium]|nr:TonB-dependent receptor [Cytophagales bacterium]